MTDDSSTEPAGNQDSGGIAHRLKTVRQQQGVSLRTLAKYLGVTIPEARELENECNGDISVAQLLAAHRAFPDVPFEELLIEPGLGLSSATTNRAHFVRVMKTARALFEAAPNERVQRLSQMLIEQLLELMPELKDVTAWHSVGQRRSNDEMGRIADRTSFGNFEHDDE